MVQRPHSAEAGRTSQAIGRGGHGGALDATIDEVAPKPANLTFERAAAVPISACTALHGLRDKGEVHEGLTVLIIGASAAVGTSAVHLAKAFGAEVTGVCSTTKVDLVRSFGADHT